MLDVISNASEPDTVSTDFRCETNVSEYVVVDLIVTHADAIIVNVNQSHGSAFDIAPLFKIWVRRE
jgi:hypothetical protein